MTDLINSLADLVLTLVFVFSCGLALVVALGQRQLVGHARTVVRVLVGFSIFLVLGFLLVVVRVGFDAVGAMTLVVFALGAGLTLLLTWRNGPSVFVLALVWLAMFGLGAVWDFRLLATGGGSAAKALLIMVMSFAALVSGASSGWLGKLFVRISPAVLVLGGLILVALPRLTFNQTNGAYISVAIPYVGEVQPGELGRFFLLLWLARSVSHYQPLMLLARSRFSVANLRLLLITTLPVICGVLVGALSNDFGPSLVLSGATLAVVFVGGLGYRYIAWVAATSTVGLALLAATNAKVRGRLDIMLTPIPESGDISQVGQGLVLMAHGPTGLGRGLPHLVPMATNDMLLAAIGHEMGILVIGAIAVLLVAGLAAARSVVAGIPDSRIQFAVVGVITSLVLQSMLMVGAVLAAAPLTGMPVPFLATSGSSLITSSLSLGLILSAARRLEHQLSADPGVRRFTVLGMVGALALVGLILRTIFLGVTFGMTLDAAKGRDPYAARVAALALPTLTTSDGVVIATTTSASPGRPRLANVTRVQPQGAKYATVLGSVVRPGLEASVATTHPCRGLAAIKVDGCGEVQTTLNSEVQNAAWQAMAGKTGAAVAVDTRTGAVLAYVSTVTGSVVDPRDRARSETIAPGSTAKIVSAGLALENKLVMERPATSTYSIPGGGEIAAVRGVPCGGSLSAAMAASCNPYFASLGADLGAERLSAGASAWLNNQTAVTGMKIARSSLLGSEKDTYHAAAGAIGLGDAQVTALGMVQFTSQVARGGEPVCLHLLEDDPSSCGGQARLEPRVATQLTGAMRAVVTTGTARNVPGLAALQAAAKTGTADTTSLSNATFVTFAPYSKPRVAVVVFIEPGPEGRQGLTGSKDAGPVATTILSAALRVTQ